MGRRPLSPEVRRNNKLRRDRQDAARRRASKRGGRDDYINALVLHPRRLADVLIATGFLREEDRDHWPSVNEALGLCFSMSDGRPMRESFAWDYERIPGEAAPEMARIRITERLRAGLTHFWGDDDPRSRSPDLLARAATAYVYHMYSTFCFDPPSIPCTCRHAMPQCDCVKRFGSPFYKGHSRHRHNGKPLGHVDGMVSTKDGRVVAAPGYRIETPKDTE
jgi:hypothetical protein